jgi:hypothetical protein
VMRFSKAPRRRSSKRSGTSTPVCLTKPAAHGRGPPDNKVTLRSGVDGFDYRRPGIYGAGRFWLKSARSGPPLEFKFVLDGTTFMDGPNWWSSLPEVASSSALTMSCDSLLRRRVLVTLRMPGWIGDRPDDRFQPVP